MSLIVGETVFQRALAYAAAIAGATAQVSAATQATLTFNGAQFHEPIAILKAVSAGKSAIAPATAAAEAQVAQWASWAAPEGVAALQTVESALTARSYLAGHRFTLADPLVFYQISSALSAIAAPERSKYPAILRWLDQILHEQPSLATVAGAPAAIELPARAPLQLALGADGGQSKSQAKKDAKAAAKASKKGDAAEGAAAAPAPATAPPAEVDPITECDFRVGLIVEAWKHPSADKLYCEKIDVGDASGPREIASGLVPYFTVEQMQQRRCIVVANLKPAKLAGFVSNGMVLCATSAEGKVEFVTPPADAKVGERVTFAGFEGPAAEPNRMAKKKIFEAAAPELRTNDGLVACYKGVPFMTSAGPCTVESAKNSLIK